jgi:hypothetical protein
MRARRTLTIGLGVLPALLVQCAPRDPGGERRAITVTTCRLTMKVPSNARVTETPGKANIDEGAATRHPRAILLETAPPSTVAPPSAVQRRLAPDVLLSATERASAPGEGNDESGESSLEGVLSARGCSLRVSCRARGQEPDWCVPYLATLETAAPR